MNVMIVGKNAQNKDIAAYFEGKGFTPVLVEEPAALKRFEGEFGDFYARVGQGDELDAGFVVLTQQPHQLPAPIDGGAVKDLYAENKPALLDKKNRTMPVVFLLDWYDESPMAATIQALDDAMALADKKRRVYYLARFVRTGGAGVEKLYRAARNAGVVFVKYEQLDIAYDYDADRFTFKATDGVLDFEVETGTVFADGGRAVDEDYADFTKKLNLWPDAAGYLNADRYFLAPVFTSRRGVFAISRDVQAERLYEGLETIHAAVLAEACADEEERCTAQVDGEKCVLCYSCYRACPHGAMAPNQQARKMDNLARACEGCGICVSVCPGNAIQLPCSEETPRLADKSAKTLVLCCENSAAIAAEKALPALGGLAAQVELQPVPCGGAVGLEDISGALQSYGRVMVAVCMDDACQHFDGNKRACRQAQRFGGMLQQAGIDPGRVGYAQVSHAMPFVLRDELESFIRGEKA